MSRRRKVVELKAFSGIRRMVGEWRMENGAVVVVVVMVKRRTAMVAESQAISTRIDKKGGRKNETLESRRRSRISGVPFAKDNW